MYIYNYVGLLFRNNIFKYCFFKVVCIFILYIIFSFSGLNIGFSLFLYLLWFCLMKYKIL